MPPLNIAESAATLVGQLERQRDRLQKIHSCLFGAGPPTILNGSPLKNGDPSPGGILNDVAYKHDQASSIASEINQTLSQLEKSLGLIPMSSGDDGGSMSANPTAYLVNRRP